MKKNEIAEAILEVLSSPNEPDSNGEAANIVDALCKCGRGLHRIADALEKMVPIGLGGAGGSPIVRHIHEYPERSDPNRLRTTYGTIPPTS